MTAEIGILNKTGVATGDDDYEWVKIEDIVSVK